MSGAAALSGGSGPGQPSAASAASKRSDQRRGEALPSPRIAAARRSSASSSRAAGLQLPRGELQRPEQLAQTEARSRALHAAVRASARARRGVRGFPSRAQSASGSPVGIDLGAGKERRASGAPARARRASRTAFPPSMPTSAPEVAARPRAPHPDQGRRGSVRRGARARPQVPGASRAVARRAERAAARSTRRRWLPSAPAHPRCARRARMRRGAAGASAPSAAGGGRERREPARNGIEAAQQQRARSGPRGASAAVRSRSPRSSHGSARRRSAAPRKSRAPRCRRHRAGRHTVLGRALARALQRFRRARPYPGRESCRAASSAACRHNSHSSAARESAATRAGLTSAARSHSRRAQADGVRTSGDRPHARAGRELRGRVCQLHGTHALAGGHDECAFLPQVLA